MIDFDGIWQKYSTVSRIEFVCFSFRIGSLFFINFSSFKPDTENNANFGGVSSKCGATLMPLSKEDKILIKSLQECKGYDARQSITEFLNKGWTKNSINRLLVKFGTVDRRLGSGRHRAHTDRNRRHS